MVVITLYCQLLFLFSRLGFPPLPPPVCLLDECSDTAEDSLARSLVAVPVREIFVWRAELTLIVTPRRSGRLAASAAVVGLPSIVLVERSTRTRMSKQPLNCCEDKDALLLGKLLKMDCCCCCRVKDMMCGGCGGGGQRMRKKTSTMIRAERKELCTQTNKKKWWRVKWSKKRRSWRVLTRSTSRLTDWSLSADEKAEQKSVFCVFEEHQQLQQLRHQSVCVQLRLRWVSEVEVEEEHWATSDWLSTAILHQHRSFLPSFLSVWVHLTLKHAVSVTKQLKRSTRNCWLLIEFFMHLLLLLLHSLAAVDRWDAAAAGRHWASFEVVDRFKLRWFAYAAAAYGETVAMMAIELKLALALAS